MTYEAHKLVSWRGRLGTAGLEKETWSCQMRFATALPLIWETGAADGLANAFGTMFTNTLMGFTSAVTFEETRCYSIDVTGHAVGEVVFGTTDLVRGATTSYQHPFQCSVVASFSAHGTGPGRHGRMYLPPMGHTIDANDVFSGIIAENLADGVMQLLTDCDALGYTPTIFSKISGVAPHAIDTVRVGRVMDTQRRRRRSIVEGYAVRTFP